MLNKLNHYITDTFADALGVLHLIVIVTLIYLSYQYIQNKYLLIEYLGEFGKHGFIVIFIIFGTYVLFVGALTTLVSINQNLRRMIELLERTDYRSIGNTSYSEPILRTSENLYFADTSPQNISAPDEIKSNPEQKTTGPKLGLQIIFVTIILVTSGIFLIWYFGNKNSQEKIGNADIPKLLAQEREANDRCRGGSGGDPQTYASCSTRDALVIKLNKLGWCYGKRNQAGYQMSWHQCDTNSNK